MQKDLEARTTKFSLRIIKLCATLPNRRDADILARQLLRSATSIGANYREANRGVSRADFAHKIGTIEKEAAETQYWLEILMEPRIASGKLAEDVMAEATELLAIFTSIRKKLR